jgi:hypothetical protein
MVAKISAAIVAWIAVVGVLFAETGPFVTDRSAKDSLNHQGLYTCIAHLRRTLRSTPLHVEPIVEIEVLSDHRYYHFRARMLGQASIRIGCATSRNGRRVLRLVAG